MVVTMVPPAAEAKAADEMAINKSSQILYVNEGINHKGAEGVPAGKGNVSVYDFYVKNKPEDWKTAYKFTWSSSNDDVVSVKAGGVATAVGVGTANVICKVTDKATGDVETLKTKVTVKANAYDVEITNADDYDGTVVEAGDVVDLNRAMYDEDGNKTSTRGKLVTDYTRWVAEPAAGVTINQKNGKFTFGEDAVAGEYKLYCETYQSSKYTDTTATSNVVTVVIEDNTTVEVKQVNTKKVNLTLGSAVKALEVADVTVNRMVGDYAYAQVVKSVSVAEDGVSVTVEVFNDFVDGANYVIDVKGFDEAAMVASVGTPVRMEIIAKDKNPAFVLTTGAQATLQCVFYDKNDVDVTAASNYEASVTYKSETAASTDFTLLSNKLTIKKNTASVVVVANYRGKFENGKLVGALEAKREFIAQDTPAIYPTGVKAFELDGNWNNGSSKTSLQVGEKTQELYLQLNLSNGKDEKFDLNVTNEVAFGLNNNGLNERITVTAVTPDVADLVGGVVIPHKAGTAVFYVNYGMKSNNQWNDVPFASIEIVVIEDAYLNSIAIATPNFIVSTVDTYLLKNGESVSSNDYLYSEENADKALWQFLNDETIGIDKRVGLSQNANNILGYDQRGGRIDLGNKNTKVAPTPVITCLTKEYGNGYNAADIAGWPYVSTYYNGNNYWADQNDQIGLTIDGAMLKHYFVSKGLFDKADNGEYLTLDYEVAVTSNGNTYKAYFTVTVAEPTSGYDNAYVKTSSTYVDIARYVTANDYNSNTEKTKTVEFEVFEVNNGVTVGTVNGLTAYNEAAKAEGVYQYKVFKDGTDITNNAIVSLGKSSSYPYSSAGDLVSNNKVIITLSDKKADAGLNVALAVTGGAFVPNYNVGGVGVYTFELYQWVTGSNNALEAKLLAQSDVTVVLGDTGAYSIDVNAQKSNSVVVGSNGGYDNYNAVDAFNILKCFTIKNRDGKAVLKTDNNGALVLDGEYTYYVNYSAPTGADYVYVKEIVFFEELVADSGEYAPYTVTVDTILER